MSLRFLPVCLAALGLAATAHAQAPPPDAEAQFSTGLGHLREGRSDLATDAFKEAVKKDPKNPYFRKGLGQAYAIQRKFKEAAAEFRKALELNPYYVDVRNDLGAALIFMGQRDNGKKEFLTAYNDATNRTPEISARNLGQAYYEEKNFPQALTWFQTSITKNKKYPDGYLGMADTLVALGRGEEAVAQLERGLENAPDDAGVLVALGEAYFRVGRFTEARVKLEQATKKDPGGPAGKRAAELLKNLPK